MLLHDFGTYQYEPFERRLNPTDGMDEVNTIYVRDLAYVEQRLKTAASFQVNGVAF